MSKLFFNKRWALFILLFITLILLGVCTFDNEPGISLAIIAIGGILFLSYIFLFPNSYKLDEKGITIYYGFGIKTFSNWSDLRTVEEHYSKGLPWLREYHIGYFKTKFPLYEKASIPKDKKTAVLIERYYNKTVNKYG